ncbi:hypothetical protein ABB37_08404 [Leptomonas pyrrhocoris]|uniref:Uncharacterized protein n=1 Tax=Leptomonas pyrrhocoris TaxID=157538 RepID=A0A0M9FT88_LEPPY|nr:hypothetical protein ABB37_08404 [Leptomonas pyrrhocoris]KPA75507.1 hypothetical protein ABB37_08404 [Leptomonas pyrrhocoris]|eukprot:XP_015653946.1 hypothetical protein ABB37_08404 [Leptomonas pyrrhocoris]
MSAFSLRNEERGGRNTHVAVGLPSLLRLLFAVLLCPAVLPCHAYVYTTTLTASQYPATYAAAHPSALPIRGLYDACVAATDTNASSFNRGALVFYSDNLTTLLAAAVPSGRVYLGGFYVPEMGAYDGWCWDDGRSTTCPGLFCTGAACTRVPTSTVPLRWAAGYPKVGADGTVGRLMYMVYDASLHGWVNVDGTAALDGVACQSDDSMYAAPKKKKRFPWWAILIIVLGCVAVVAVVLTVVLCCCCKKKQRYTDDNEDGESALSSRSGSFRTQSTSFAGSSRTGSFSRSSSFSSRGSSFSGASKSSSVTGSTATSSVGSASLSSSAASRSRRSFSPGSSVSSYPSRGSSTAGSFSRASSSSGSSHS